MLSLLLQIEVTHVQAGVILGALFGGLFGLVPLVFGIIKKRPKIGILGFIGSIIGNAILGLLLSVPIIVLCVYLILKKDNPMEASVANENPIEAKIDSSENR